MKNVLFVCSGNSCRSQIAEGWGKALGNDKYNIESAGTNPIGVLQSTVETMNEVGIDITSHTSDLLTEGMFKWADFVITLCSHARDNCPVIPPDVIHQHWDTANPDRFYTSEAERKIEFAKTRDQIKNRVEKLFAEITAGTVHTE